MWVSRVCRAGHVLLFSGQGSQRVGMGKSLQSLPAARAVLEEADAVLGEKLTQVMFEGPSESLITTHIAQCAILTHSTAAHRALEAEVGSEFSSRTAAVMGHSLGEFSALVASGALQFADALRLVRARGLAMQEAVGRGEGGMAALVPLTDTMAGYLVEECRREGYVVDVANINSSSQIVVSGTVEGVRRACELAEEQYGVMRVTHLDVSAPFHSRLMKPAQDRLAPLIASLAISPPSCPVIPNITATPTRDPEVIRGALVAQITGQVRWNASCKAALALSPSQWIEFGARPVLTTLVKRMSKAKASVCGEEEHVRAFASDLSFE